MTDTTLRGMRVLLVEDEYMIATAVKLLLEEMGVEVVGPATSLPKALKLLEQNERLDGVIMDVNLGGERSFALADAAQARGINCVLTTGYDLASIPAAYSDLPILLKPIRLKEMSSALAKRP